MGISDLNSSLSAGIYLYRKMRNLSAEECAAELGISKTTLVKIEQKKANPTLDTVSLIAKNMGCDPSFLLGQKYAGDQFAAILLMSLLKDGNQYTLETLQAALNHMQMALDILLTAQQTSQVQKDESISD